MELSWFNSGMQQFLRLWYLESGPWALHRYLSTVRVLDGTFAIADTWRNLGRPLFQDYTWQGRIIGFFLRLARIGVGLFVYLLAALLYAAAYLIWLVFPLVAIISLLGGFFGPGNTPLS